MCIFCKIQYYFFVIIYWDVFNWDTRIDIEIIEVIYDFQMWEISYICQLFACEYVPINFICNIGEVFSSLKIFLILNLFNENINLITLHFGGKYKEWMNNKEISFCYYK